MQESRYQRIKSNYAAIAATLALVLALGTSGAWATGVFVTSKQIKNGTILSADIKNNQVKTPDIKNGTVDSVDIGNGQVNSQDLSLPAPEQITLGVASGPVTAQFAPLVTVGTYAKETAESTLQIEWSGAVGPGPGTNCVFQLRVNGQPSAQGGGEAFATSEAANVGTVGIFPGLGVGPVAVEVWSKFSAQNSPNPTCVLDPANPGITSTFILSEAVE